jgi:prevent-host-death family protein
MRVSIHELKAGLARYVAKARGGEVIEVTLHNKPVVRIVGILPVEKPGIARLLARGAASWSGGKPSLQTPLRLHVGGRSMSDIVIEDRG